MKKTSKSQTVVATPKKSQAGNIVWSIIALGGMFACGWALCMALTGCEQVPEKPRFSDAQCATLADKITWSLNDNNADVAKATQEIFAANCGGYVPAAPKMAKPVKVEDKDLSTCERIEQLLTSRLFPEDSMNVLDHAQNVKTYGELENNGCPENKEKWMELKSRAYQIGTVLNEEELNEILRNVDVAPCKEIERAVESEINHSCENWGSVEGKVDCFLNNAKIYSSLEQKGCPKNRGQYRQLALQQIEIATALQDESEMSQEDVESVIDTYKKLEMQAQAKQVLDKVQKLTDPAIDFIIQMEKIINEE